MSVTVAGVVEKWFSEKNCIQWDFEVVDEGEYDVYLYTLTQKYQPWIGGHIVHLEGDVKTHSKELVLDKKSKGANKKYFDETGSYLGNVTLTEGKNQIKLIADLINSKDGAGLSVSKLVLIKKEFVE